MELEDFHLTHCSDPPEGNSDRDKSTNNKTADKKFDIKYSERFKMPTMPFTCEALIHKDGEAEPSKCPTVIGEYASLKDAQMAYQNHLEIHKMNGVC